MAIYFTCFDNGKHYSTQDLIDNYKEKNRQISDLKAYIKNIVPANKVVDIEFDDNGDLSIFHVTDVNNSDYNWRIKSDSKKTDTLLKTLNWTRKTLKTLKEKLNAANCISVENGEPCVVGFQRSGMGKYYYNIFDAAISEPNRTKYNDSCTYILYTDTVVLEYGGGAIGPQCFPK